VKLRSLIVASLLVILTVACGKDDSSNANSTDRFSRFGGGGFGSRVTSVETESVKQAPIALQVRAYGTVQAQDIVSIIPQVSNRITKMYVDLGDTVKRGQVLAKIYDVPFRGQLEGAKAQIRQAEVALARDSAQFSRQKQLFDGGLTSEFDYQNAEAVYLNSKSQLDAARGNFAQSEENLMNTEVKSPVNGVVSARFAEEGNIASNGQALFEIANLVGYESRIFVPAQDWSVIKIGQEVRLRATNEGEIGATGVVSRKSPQLDATTGLGEIVVSLTNSGASIYPGVLTENVITIQSKPNAIVVERSSLVEKVETILNPESNSIELDRSYAVFVSVGDSVAERRTLELGIEQGQTIEVLSGLNPSDKIITTGQTGLTDGAKIRVASGSTFTSPEKKTIAGQGGNPGGWGSRPQAATSASSDTTKAAPRRGGSGVNMSDEERAKLREQMANMSPEERRAFMQKMRAQRDSTSSN
jgi:RND family efflux transporter MFP subunit